ncbi:MAG: 6-phosphogluconolactonase [Gloeocapsa sp. DLM2.Bin57]|nr:MAG: 6-phosphogluconolactonase [Gloeocapsa sp. DLM2.Bin57]
MEKHLEILADKSSLIGRALALVKAKIIATLEVKEKCRIALAGGNTPKPLYEAISATSLPWDKIEVFWGDERYVSPDDPQSNQKMARYVWLNKVNFPEANIYPMPTDSGNPSLDAQKYETALLEAFGLAVGEIPVFDLIFLGIGDDAHTASLFPKTPALTVSDRLITVGNKDGQPRLTFTYPLINAADCVIFLVTGANKQPALSQIFAPEADGMLYPARLIKPQGELWWLLDGATRF